MSVPRTTYHASTPDRTIFFSKAADDEDGDIELEGPSDGPRPLVSSKRHGSTILRRFTASVQGIIHENAGMLLIAASEVSVAVSYTDISHVMLKSTRLSLRQRTLP